jgi:hypothetical protein
MLRDTDYNPLTLLQKLVLLPLTKDRSLRILHIRQSGADCEQIGSWGIEDIYDYTGSELDSPAAEEPTQTERVVENYRGEGLKGCYPLKLLLSVTSPMRDDMQKAKSSSSGIL